MTAFVGPSRIPPISFGANVRSLITANGLLYFLYNTRLHQRTFLTARSIDAEGTLDTDSRFKEDLALRDLDNAYECFPRLAKIVDAGEIIIPCRKGGYFCLAKINF